MSEAEHNVERSETAEQLSRDLSRAKREARRNKRIARTALSVLSFVFFVILFSGDAHFGTGFFGETLTPHQKLVYFRIVLPGANLGLAIFLLILSIRLNRLSDFAQDV